MATLNINGKRVKVSDDFLSLSPEQQNATVDEIASQMNTQAPSPPAVEAPAQPQDSGGIGRAIDDFGRGFADTGTFGLADEISAGMGAATGIGGDFGEYSKNLDAQRARDSEGGWSRMAGQLAGAVATPLGTAKSLLGAMGQGALFGGAYGFGSGEDGFANRMKNAGVGAAVGGAAGGIVRAGANALQTKAVRKLIPTNEQLTKWKNAAYKQSEDAGDIVPSTEVQGLAGRIQNDLADHGFDPANEPGIMPVVRRLENMQNENVTLKGLDVLRKVANNGYIIGNKSNNELVRKVVNRIDEMTDGLSGTDALKRGRDYARRLIKSEQVDKQVARAELRAASTGSGGNVDNATRQNVRRMVENPRGMTATEKQAAERVVRGTPAQNALRLAGKLSPQGNGLMTAMGIGGAMVNPLYGIPALVGTAAKALADRGTVKNVARLSEIIRSGGYSAKELAALAREGKLPLSAVKAIEAAEKQYQNRMATVSAMYANKIGQPTH